MDHETTSTRRSYLAGGAALVASGLLAGCAGGDSTATETGGETYSVSMEPVGEVEFDSVPETWVANNGSWADMGVALGQEPPKALWLTNRYHTQYYDAIDGVSVDKSGMRNLYSDGVDKELFYELGGDVHVIDPNFLLNRFSGWEQADVDEIEENVGPFFGSSIFSRGYGWHEDYQYYSLYEAFEKLSQVFQEGERYEAMVEVHNEFQSTIESVVPAEGERPSAAVVWAAGNEPESFSPYIIGEGSSFKHLRELGVRDAFADTDVRDFHSDRSSVDYETLLEIDPDVLLCRGHEAQTAEEFQDTVVSFMENHDVASDLTAVKNGDVYRGGPLYQGPITNMVVTERTAQDLYDAEDDLYDAGRVADIVNGDF
ncbi:ABC transporter substrate-binding protein [Halolamina salifodinae]|uniref:Iron complex transport system substrate-binding protein n=1 Tax=Halolamina salifodinae TaxID=1202767 RepID=A0A8T4GTX3_9EURY|nr:ABC transporter substrate-binding protein [Halolamina salifodinae]MBP1986339.1 iron complex transport system substrate-binding protein [Halolamina salifodinae]